MYKRMLSLLVVAGLVSAGLILGGTSVMSHLSPVSAAQPSALIAGGSGGASGPDSLSADSKTGDLRHDGQTAMPVASDTSSASQPWPAWESQGGQSAGSSISQTQPTSNTVIQPGPAVTVTIAELLADPSSYLGRVVSTAGRVTLLGSDKLLINDGTGQIIVDLKDDLKKAAITNGAIATVVGKVDQIGGGSALSIAARTVTGSGSATGAGKRGGDNPARPTPKTGCDDDDCGKPGGNDPARPTPKTSCDDDDCDDDRDDVGDDQDDVDDDGRSDDDSGDDDSGDDDSGDDDSGDDDSGDDDSGDDDGGDDDSGDDDSGDDGDDD